MEWLSVIVLAGSFICIHIIGYMAGKKDQYKKDMNIIEEFVWRAGATKTYEYFYV